MVVRGKVKKWGNSLGLRLHKMVAEQLRLEDGSEVEIRVSGNRLVVTLSAPKYSLAGLLERVNDRNVHVEADTGSPRGTEIW
jgi:antitoxin MazE